MKIQFKNDDDKRWRRSRDVLKYADESWMLWLFEKSGREIKFSDGKSSTKLRSR